MSATVVYDSPSQTAMLTPVATLSYSTIYTVSLTAAITDTAPAANPLMPVSWTFTTAAVPPLITGFAPLNGPVGTEVTLVGANFTGTTAVAFNGGPATNLSVVSDSEIRVTVPAGDGIATDPNFKVAFIGDTDDGTGFQDLLSLIQGENVDLVLHQGDFSYSSGPTQSWTDAINNTLGATFPYLGSDGNHAGSSQAHS